MLIIAFISVAFPELKAQAWFTTGQDASLMISGFDFNQTGGPVQFNHPSGLAGDGTKLIVCDRFNNRVLVWNTAPATWNALPDLVLGQNDFYSNNPGTAKNNLNWPGNASVSKTGRLAIADTNNDRLLLWSSFPVSSGQPADVSIHLPTISPKNIPMRWAWPWGVWTDGTRLAAVATMGGTLLFWNTFPSTDNQPPDYTVTHASFGTPRNISTDGSTYFFVGDHNAKVNGIPGTYFWSSYPASSNLPYDFYRNEWIKGTRLPDGRLIAAGLKSIYTWNNMPLSSDINPDLTASLSYYSNGDGVDVIQAGSKIFICNYNGNNILAFNNPPFGGQENPLFALGAPDYNRNTLDSMGYIQNGAMATDGTRLIITSDFNRKIYVFNRFPDRPGQLPDAIIPTTGYDLAAWDNALYNNKFVAAGRNRICVWNNASNLGQNPSVIFNGNIGSAVFDDLKGIALDNRYLYVAERTGKIYIWNGIPTSGSVNPVLTLNLGNVELNRLSSDGTYLCIAQQSPAAILIYKTESLALGDTTPWKIIPGTGFLNLPGEAITFNGSLAIANTSFNEVLLWRDINDAPALNKMVVLGQSGHSTENQPAIGRNRLFMPGALLFENNNLWVAEHKFSSRILKFSLNTSYTKESACTEQFSIYPNPAGHEVNLRMNSRSDGRILLIHPEGKILRNYPVENSLEMKLNIADLPAGIYFVTFLDGIHSPETLKLAVTRPLR